MFKRVLITVILLAAGICSALESTYIETQNYGSAVSRIVIGLYGTGAYKVEQGNNFVEIKLDNSDVSKLNISIPAGGLLKSIEQFGDKIIIAISCPFCLEQMILDSPRRLVLDIIVAQPDKQQKLEIADFYTSTGKLNSADRIYGQLHHKYPEDHEILYKWVLLLKQRGSSRLKDVAAKIPQNSEYYPLAQQIVKGNYRDKTTLIYPEGKTKNACKISSTGEKTTTESIYIIPETQQETKQPSKPDKEKKLYSTKWIRRIMLIIILILLLILIYHFIANISRKKRKTAYNINIEPESKEKIPPEENKTFFLMVCRLLDFGWTNHKKEGFIFLRGNFFTHNILLHISII